MTGALRYELVRIRTIASSYWMSTAAILLTSGLCFLLALTLNLNDFAGGDFIFDEDRITVFVVLAGSSITGIPVLAAPFLAVIGAMAMGHEYRYGTNKATLSALPDRIAVLAAKLLVLMGWVAAVVAAIVVLDLAIAWLFLDGFGIGGETWRPVLMYLSYCEGFAISGFALAAIFRNLTGAIVAALVIPYVIEPILYGIFAAIANTSHRGIGKVTNLLPASAGKRTLFLPYDAVAGFGGQVETWSLPASFAVFWVAIAITTAVGCTLFITRDA